MPLLSLRAAAERAGTSKTSLFRAVKAGRVSASRDDRGRLQIDPSELARVYPVKPQERSENAPLEHHGMADGMAGMVALQVRNADLTARVELLSRMLADVQTERDRWAAQAERLTLAPPKEPPETPSGRFAWWWRRGGASRA
jgi:hypothetical protein